MAQGHKARSNPTPPRKPYQFSEDYYKGRTMGDRADRRVEDEKLSRKRGKIAALEGLKKAVGK